MLYVAIVEDNPITAGILREYVEGEELRVTAVYSSGEDALKMIPAHPLPDVILMDIGLPGISGIEVTRRLKGLYPGLEIVIQTVFEDSKNIMEAIRAGASGYILKASSREDIINALWEVKKGGSFLTGKIARKVLQEFHEPEKLREGAVKCFELTEREEEILKELIKGSSYKDISDSLSLSIHTVNNHIRKIYEKMRVSSRGEAVARAISTASSVPLPGSE